MSAAVSEAVVLWALRKLTADGWPANVREIQEASGLLSPSTVHDALLRLEKAGLVRTNPRWSSRKGGWKPIIPQEGEGP